MPFVKSVQVLTQALVESQVETCMNILADASEELGYEQVLLELLPQSLMLAEVEHLQRVSSPSELTKTLRCSMKCTTELAINIDKRLSNKQRVAIFPMDSGFASVYAEIIFIALDSLGWEVDYIGAHTDLSDFSKYLLRIDTRGLVLVESRKSEPVRNEKLTSCLSQLCERGKGGKSFTAILFSSKEAGGTSFENLLSVNDLENTRLTVDASTVVTTLNNQLSHADRLASYREYQSALGRRIKARRKELSLSQEVLSERASVNRAFISSIENAKVNPSLETLYKLADILKLPLHELLEINQ